MSSSVCMGIELGRKTLLVTLVLILQGTKHHHTQIQVPQTFLRHVRCKQVSGH